MKNEKLKLIYELLYKFGSFDAEGVFWGHCDAIGENEAVVNYVFEFIQDYEKKARQDEQRRIVDTLNELSTWCLSEDTPDFWEINDVLRVIETPEIHKAMMKEKVKQNEK